MFQSSNVSNHPTIFQILFRESDPTLSFTHASACNIYANLMHIAHCISQLHLKIAAIGQDKFAINQVWKWHCAV